MTPPNVLAKREISKESIEVIPLLPLIIPSQVSGTELAKHVTAPNPVITTRRLLNVVYRKKSEEEDDGIMI
jgi:ABC-type molybdate transport system permease subunit